MIVEVAIFLASIGGSIDPDHYLRAIPGRPGFAVYCQKPKYSKKKKKEMASGELALNFKAMQDEARRQYRDPVLRAKWEKKHKAALRNASKHGSSKMADGRPKVPIRLWDYVRREVVRLKTLEKH